MVPYRTVAAETEPNLSVQCVYYLVMPDCGGRGARPVAASGKNWSLGPYVGIMKTTMRLGLLVIVLNQLGCGGSNGGGGNPGTGGGGGAGGMSASDDMGAGGMSGDGGPGTGMSGNGALSIVSLTTTIGMVVKHPIDSDRETDQTTFIAIVTDTKGLDTIAGGQLTDETGATYAAFGAGANKGTYTASVSWDIINNVRALAYDGTSGQRQFIAKFFDNDGNVATASVPLSFECHPDPTTAGASNVLLGVCKGECVLKDSDARYCGSCGTSCNKASRCMNSQCIQDPGVPTCFYANRVPLAQTCEDVCGGLGKQCHGASEFSRSAACADAGTSLSCTDRLLYELPIVDRYQCNCQ